MPRRSVATSRATAGTRPESVDEWGDLAAQSERRTPRDGAATRRRGGGGGAVVVARGEVWWHEAPDERRRPYLVLTRDEVIPFLTQLIAVPITRTIRGIPTEVPLDRSDGMAVECVRDRRQPCPRAEGEPHQTHHDPRPGAASGGLRRRGLRHLLRSPLTAVSGRCLGPRRSGAAAVGAGDDLEEVAVGAAEVDAPAAVVVVDLAGPARHRVGPVLQAPAHGRDRRWRRSRPRRRGTRSAGRRSPGRPTEAKSRATPLAVSTCQKWPNKRGWSTPKRSANQRAASSASRAATIVWLSCTGMDPVCPPSRRSRAGNDPGTLRRGSAPRSAHAPRRTRRRRRRPQVGGQVDRRAPRQALRRHLRLGS